MFDIIIAGLIVYAFIGIIIYLDKYTDEQNQSRKI